jgi:hypothetical protein
MPAAPGLKLASSTFRVQIAASRNAFGSAPM